jgi:PD-(D/E)XK nuclease superfamily protein
MKLLPAKRGCLEVGIAAEHLVCADLLLMGYRAFKTDQHCPYDIAVDILGRLIRVQVKATSNPRLPWQRRHTPSYVFHVRRAGKGGKRLYSVKDFDVAALVALDIRRVAYLKLEDIKQCVTVRVPGVDYSRNNTKGDGRSFDELTFARCL